MVRLIDADAYLKKVCTYKETGCGSCKLQTFCPSDEPTVDAIPIDWMLNDWDSKELEDVGYQVMRRIIADWRGNKNELRGL